MHDLLKNIQKFKAGDCLQIKISESTGQTIFVKTDSLKILREAKAKSKAEKKMKSLLRATAEPEARITMQSHEKTTSDLFKGICSETLNKDQGDQVDETAKTFPNFTT